MASRFPSSGSPPYDQVDIQRLRRLRQYAPSDSEAHNVVDDSLDPSDLSRLRRLRMDIDASGTSGDSFDRQVKRRMRRLKAVANSSDRFNDLDEFEQRFNRYRGMKSSPSSHDAGWYPRRRVSSARSRLDGGVSPASSVGSFHSLPTYPASSYATVDGEPMNDDDVFDNSPVGVSFTRPRSDSHQYFADMESYSPGSHWSGRRRSSSVSRSGSQAASRRWDRYYRDSGSFGSPSNADLRSIMVDIPTYDTSPSRYLDASGLSGPSNRQHVTFDPSLVSTPILGASGRPYTFQTLDPSALDTTGGYTNYAYPSDAQYIPSSDPRTDDSMRAQFGNYAGRPQPNPDLPYSPMDDIERDILAHNKWVGRRMNPVQNEYPCPSPRPIRPPQALPGTPQPYRGTLGQRWDPRVEQFNMDMPSSDSDTQGPNCRCANPCSRSRSTCSIL